MHLQDIFNKTKRFNEAYNYVRSKGSFHTQVELASLMQCSRSNISMAKKGNENCLTQSFIRRFCRTFPEINENWILTGEGEMLVALVDEKKVPDLFSEEHSTLIRLQSERDAIRSIIREVNDPQSALSIISKLLSDNLK